MEKNNKFISEDENESYELDEEKSEISINAIRSLEERSIGHNISFEKSIVNEKKKVKKNKKFCLTILEEKKTTKKVNKSLHINLMKVREMKNKVKKRRPNTARTSKRKTKTKSFAFAIPKKKKNYFSTLKDKLSLNGIVSKSNKNSSELIINIIDKFKTKNSKKVKKKKINDKISFQNLKEKKKKIKISSLQNFCK